jgi:hypothetical protein
MLDLLGILDLADRDISQLGRPKAEGWHSAALVTKPPVVLLDGQ